MKKCDLSFEALVEDLTNPDKVPHYRKIEENNAVEIICGLSEALLLMHENAIIYKD